MSHIDFARLDAERDALAAQFCDAKPFPHVVIDDFLRPMSLDQLLAQIPSPIIAQRSSDYIFAKNKFEDPGVWSTHPIFGELRDELLSDRFKEWLAVVYGRDVFVDRSFLGGGLHQGGAGSFLDMHADFNRHPVNQDWLRELNILLYLNPDYRSEYRGALDLRHKKTGEILSIEPRLNRLVVMLTKAHTLHGYRPTAFPEGAFRTSLAAYAYSLDRDHAAMPAQSTKWRPERAGIAKNAIAALTPALVKIKTGLFGSRTARRARD